MKSFLYLIGIIVLTSCALFLLRPSMAPMESEYLDLKLGAGTDAQMRAAEESDKFNLKGGIYYSISSKKPFEDECSIEVVIKNTADLSNVIFTEKLGTKDKMITRQANRINSESEGEYVLNLMKERRIIARKVFTISGAAQVPATPVTPAISATPATGEVAVKEAAKTSEVKTK